MFKEIFDWSELVSRGVDVVVFFVMAATGTVLFLIRLAASAFSGGGDAGDMDVDAGGNTDGAFSFFSLLSILAFFMGAGWMGLACRIDWGLASLPSAFIAGGFGFLMMSAASGLMYATRRLNKQVSYDVATAVGRTGRVYMRIPPKGTGQGQVEVTVSGRKMILRAASNGEEIPSFTEVRVVGTKDDESIVVEPTGA